MAVNTTDLGYSFRIDRKQPILDGHSRQRKKILNPFSDLPATQTNFTADIFPELLWLATVLDRFGYRPGIEIATPFQVALYKLSKRRPWYRLSEIAKLTRKQWDALPELEGAFKAAIEDALAPIAFAYPELGLKFVEAANIEAEDAINRLKSAVGRFSNRFETPGAALIGGYIFLQCFVGRMQVPRDLLEGINSIVAKPGSAEAELASSGVRATMLAMWSVDKEDRGQWSKVFWRANYRVSACELRAGHE